MTMKREEATKLLKALNMMLRSPDGEPISDACDALDMAIEALQAEPTNGRLIDADALLEAVGRIGLTCDGGVDINDLEGTIQEMADADRPHGEWIPVTERLPEIDETARICDQISEEVLGTDTYGNIRHVYLTKCGYLKPTFCTVEEGMSVDIVAWMQLPEPYEEGGE